MTDPPPRRPGSRVSPGAGPAIPFGSDEALSPPPPETISLAFGLDDLSAARTLVLDQDGRTGYQCWSCLLTSPRDVDLDADQGAILVLPAAVERTRPMIREALDSIRAISSGMANP